jgi:hypothetical protein
MCSDLRVVGGMSRLGESAVPAGRDLDLVNYARSDGDLGAPDVYARCAGAQESVRGRLEPPCL